MCFFFSSRRRHTRCALVTGVQTCALPIFDLPDIAIYAPVAPPSGSFEEFDDEDLDRAYAYVVKGFAHFVRAVAPNMKSKNWGRIITIGSGAAKSPARRSILNFDYALANTVRPAGLGDQKSVVYGKGVVVRVELGGGRIIK